MVMVLVSILVTLSAGAKSTQFDRLCLAISVLAVLGHSAYFACKARTASAFELKKLSSPEHMKTTGLERSAARNALSESGRQRATRSPFRLID